MKRNLIIKAMQSHARVVSPIALSITLALAGILLPFSSASAQGTVYTTTQYDNALSSVIHADNAQSVTLPNGKILWVFGDTTQVNGVSTVGPYGYPHDAFVLQQPGTLNFSAVPGSYGYDWQQVPNWSDGTYFWMSTPIVYNGTLYILGERIDGAANFSVVGSYVASFNATTLAYENITAVPTGATGTTTWGGAVAASGGWWITGTHGVSCSYATDCKVGDIAWVPSGDLTNESDWQVYNNVIPATDNAGTVMSPIQTSTGWDIFTKQGDAYGGTNIERLTSSTMTGTWTVNGTWPAPSPSGTVTYSTAVHPEQASPSGEVLLSYSVNGVSADYYPLFEYLPL